MIPYQYWNGSMEFILEPLIYQYESTIDTNNLLERLKTDVVNNKYYYLIQL